MKILIELDGVTVKLLVALGLAIWGCSGGSVHEMAVAMTALLDT
ncbi:hypothetical protein ACF8GB_00015 [Pseudomonas sp. xss_4]|nr:hypothetical protein [Pseudomonas putida]